MISTNIKRSRGGDILAISTLLYRTNDCNIDFKRAKNFDSSVKAERKVSGASNNALSQQRYQCQQGAKNPFIDPDT